MALIFWAVLQYLDDYGKVKGHTASIDGRRGLVELLERYHIQIDNVRSFQVDGRDYDIKKVLDNGNSREGDRRE